MAESHHEVSFVLIGDEVLIPVVGCYVDPVPSAFSELERDVLLGLC